MSVVDKALELAKHGKVQEAIAVLGDAEDALPVDALGLFYLFVEDNAAEALRLCEIVLSRPLRPAEASTWHLRRARLHAAEGRRDKAMRDYLKVIGLSTSPDQVDEANRSMLKLAGV